MARLEQLELHESKPLRQLADLPEWRKTTKMGKPRKTYMEKKPGTWKCPLFALPWRKPRFHKVFFQSEEGSFGPFGLYIYYDIFHVSTSENHSKFNPNVYLASWVCLLTCLFRRTHFLCWVFLHLVELLYFGFILMLGAIFEVMYWHSFPQRRFLGKMVNHHHQPSTNHRPTTTTHPVEFESQPLSCHDYQPLGTPLQQNRTPSWKVLLRPKSTILMHSRSSKSLGLIGWMVHLMVSSGHIPWNREPGWR